MPSSTSWKSPPRVEPDSRLTRISPISPRTVSTMLGVHIASPGRHEPPVGQALAGGEPDVVDREHQQPAADHQPDAAPGEPERHHDPDDHERDAGQADRPLLVDLDLVAGGPAVGVLTRSTAVATSDQLESRRSVGARRRGGRGAAWAGRRHAWGRRPAILGRRSASWAGRFGPGLAACCPCAAALGLRRLGEDEPLSPTPSSRSSPGSESDCGSAGGGGAAEAAPGASRRSSSSSSERSRRASRLLPSGVADDREHLAGAHLPVASHRLAGVPLQLVEDVLHPDVVDREVGELKPCGLRRTVLVDGPVVESEAQVGLSLGVGHRRRCRRR